MNKTYLIHGSILGGTVVAALVAIAIGLEQRASALGLLAAQSKRSDIEQLDARAASLQQNIDSVQQALAADKQKLSDIKKTIAEDSYRISKTQALYNEVEKKRNVKRAELKAAEKDLDSAKKRYEEALAAKAKAEEARRAEEARQAEEAKRKAESATKNKNKNRKRATKSRRHR